MYSLSKDIMQKKYTSQIQKILFMHATDQEARLSLYKDGKKPTRDDFLEIEKLDIKHTSEMKKIVENIGWPTISKVGRVTSNAAWLLVQHADKDIEFQKKCLSLMKNNKNDIELAHIAYLEDRILVKETGEQLYGTQLKGEKPFPIVNEKEVDRRREEFGMNSLKSYIQSLQDSISKNKKGVTVIENYI